MQPTPTRRSLPARQPLSRRRALARLALILLIAALPPAPLPAEYGSHHVQHHFHNLRRTTLSFALAAPVAVKQLIDSDPQLWDALSPPSSSSSAAADDRVPSSDHSHDSQLTADFDSLPVADVSEHHVFADAHQVDVGTGEDGTAAVTAVSAAAAPGSADAPSATTPQTTTSKPHAASTPAAAPAAAAPAGTDPSTTVGSSTSTSTSTNPNDFPAELPAGLPPKHQTPDGQSPRAVVAPPQSEARKTPTPAQATPAAAAAPAAAATSPGATPVSAPPPATAPAPAQSGASQSANSQDAKPNSAPKAEAEGKSTLPPPHMLIGLGAVALIVFAVVATVVYRNFCAGSGQAYDPVRTDELPIGNSRSGGSASFGGAEAGGWNDDWGNEEDDWDSTSPAVKA